MKGFRPLHWENGLVSGWSCTNEHAAPLLPSIGAARRVIVNTEQQCAWQSLVIIQTLLQSYSLLDLLWINQNTSRRMFWTDKTFCLKYEHYALEPNPICENVVVASSWFGPALLLLDQESLPSLNLDCQGTIFWVKLNGKWIMPQDTDPKNTSRPKKG